MGDNPAQFKNRKKSIDDFEVGDEVKVLPVHPSSAPGIDLDEDADIGVVEAKDERKKTIRVKGKNIDPSAMPVFKRGGRRSTASKKRVHRATHRSLKNLRKRRATKKH